MTKSVKPIPEGHHTVTPNLVCREADRAIEFYKKVFGATEKSRVTTPNGKIAHAELNIGDSLIFLNDVLMQPAGQPSGQSGSSPIHLYLYVEDADAVFKRATDAGAHVDMPLQNMFWGDRYGSITDPFGQQWGIASRIEEVSSEELRRRSDAMFSKTAAGKQ